MRLIKEFIRDIREESRNTRGKIKELKDEKRRKKKRTTSKEGERFIWTPCTRTRYFKHRSIGYLEVMIRVEPHFAWKVWVRLGYIL